MKRTKDVNFHFDEVARSINDRKSFYFDNRFYYYFRSMSRRDFDILFKFHRIFLLRRHQKLHK